MDSTQKVALARCSEAHLCNCYVVNLTCLKSPRCPFPLCNGLQVCPFYLNSGIYFGVEIGGIWVEKPEIPPKLESLGGKFPQTKIKIENPAPKIFGG